MKTIIYITGTPGSGKSTIEANLRYQSNAIQKSNYAYSNSTLFLGRYLNKSNNPTKILRYPGLDDFNSSIIDTIQTSNHNTIIMSGIKKLQELINFFKSNPDYNFYLCFHRKNLKKIFKQRLKRSINKTPSKDFASSWDTKLKKQMKLWKPLEVSHPNIHIITLKGNTLKRVNSF